MTHVAVLGDIHGNARALEAVLGEVRRAGIARLLITGDFVGYYYEPGRVFTLLQPWAYDAVQGNHEAMLLAALDDPGLAGGLRRRFGRGFDRAREELSAAQISWLRALPHRRIVEIAGRRILLAHGAPWDRDLYVYPDSREALRRCAREDADLVVLGHTHHPMLDTTGRVPVLNPGSVGQPRDGDPRAAWASIALPALDMRLRRTVYPAEEVAAEARRRDPALPHLAAVLRGGSEAPT